MTDATPATGMLTYAIGDVHGCRDKLERLIAHCRAYNKAKPARFVFVGDYVDRGPDSRGVIDFVRGMQAGADDVICLRGNHEAMMLDAAFESNADALDHWLANGGKHALASYGVKTPGAIPKDHLDWLAALRFSFDDGKRYFVHAGVSPSVPLESQTEHDQLWIREPFLSSTRDFGRFIVHGHTPLHRGRPDLRSNRLNVDTAAVLGGPLTAAVFNDERVEPIAFLTDFGSETEVVIAR
jgi:serine/threonine protein phosphatase 1